METIERNFAKIAQEIGPNAVLAIGFNHAEWTDEVGAKYLGEDYFDFYQFLPALLLTDSHPNNLSEQTTKILIPLSRVREKFEDIGTFIGMLTRLVKKQDSSLFKRFQFEEKNNLMKDANDIIHLKPNFLGIGININALLAKFA